MGDKLNISWRDFDILSDDHYVKLLHEERIRWEAIEKAVEFFFNLSLPGKDTRDINRVFIQFTF